MNRFVATHFVASYSFSTDTAAAKRQGRAFRRALLQIGGAPLYGTKMGRRGSLLVQSQTAERAQEKIDMLAAALPPDGTLSVLPITEVQLRHTRNYWGRRRPIASNEH